MLKIEIIEIIIAKYEISLIIQIEYIVTLLDEK